MSSKRKTFGNFSQKRRIFFREQVQTFLIVCEGTKTEPYYFESFRVPKDVRAIDVKGFGENTINLVNKAIDFKHQKNYDQVWCVLDVDDFPPENINLAIEVAKQNNIFVAYSNQAFELWYLLHFNYYDTGLSRNQYGDLLSKMLGHQYIKNSKNMYLELQSRQAEAIKNAKRLLSEYEPADPSKDDPSTTVFLLVEELVRFSPDSRSIK